MADTLDLTSNLKTLRTTFNGLVAEFNNVATINSITADTGSINIGSGQVNKNITINGGSNLNTSIVNGALQVAMDATPTFTSFTASGTLTLTGTSNITTANIQNLNAGIGPNDYDFPTAVGAAGEALVVNGSGNLEFGLGGTGATTFKALTDTPGTYTTLGARVLFLDGTAGGTASDVITDDTFTFDATNNFLKVEKFRSGNNINPASSIPFEIANDFTSGTVSSTMMFIDNSYDSGVNTDSAFLYGFRNQFDVIDVTTALTSVYGIYTDIYFEETLTNAWGAYISASPSSGAGPATAGVVTNLYGLQVSTNAPSGSTVTNSYGIRINGTDDGITTNAYRLYIDAMPFGPTNSYGIYCQPPIKTDEFLEFESTVTTPSGSTTSAKLYFRDEKLIIVYDDSGTVRYKYLDLTGTGVTWVHTTTAP